MVVPAPLQPDSHTAHGLRACLCFGSRCAGDMCPDIQAKRQPYLGVGSSHGGSGTLLPAPAGIHHAGQSATCHHRRTVAIAAGERSARHHRPHRAGCSHTLCLPQPLLHIGRQILLHALMGHSPIRHLDSSRHAAFLHPRHLALRIVASASGAIPTPSHNQPSNGTFIYRPTEPTAARSRMLHRRPFTRHRRSRQRQDTCADSQDSLSAQRRRDGASADNGPYLHQ